MIRTVAKKELRSYFSSAIGVIFLAAFLAVALYTFFWREKFNVVHEVHFDSRTIKTAAWMRFRVYR